MSEERRRGNTMAEDGSPAGDEVERRRSLKEPLLDNSSVGLIESTVGSVDPSEVDVAGDGSGEKPTTSASHATPSKAGEGAAGGGSKSEEEKKALLPSSDTPSSNKDTPSKRPARKSLIKRLPSFSRRSSVAFNIELPSTLSPQYPIASNMENLLASVRRAIANGKHPELVAAGSSGSYWIFDETGKRVGIFKPKSEEPYGPANPKWGKWFHRVMCPCCFGRSCLLPNTGYVSEAGAYVMDVLLDLQVVPPTSIVKLSSKAFNYNSIERRLPNLPQKIGSFQVLVDTNGDGKTLQHDSLSKEQYATLLNQFQRLVVLDYMTRNTDRGLDNWLVHVQTSVVRVHAIDNGLAFPYKHPDNWRTYPPSWSSHPLGKKPFLKEIRQQVRAKLASETWMQRAEDRLRMIMERDEILTEARFQGQLAVIRGQRRNLLNCLDNEGSTPEDLFAMHPLYIVRKASGMVGWKTHLPCFRCC